MEDCLNLRIAGYGADGAGVSRLPDGRAVFIKGALSGELCRVVIEKYGKSAAWGRVCAVLEPSPHRIAPDCPYYAANPACGGCQTRHMTYDEELRFKHGRVQEALRRLGGSEVTVSAIHGAAETLRYRNKAQFPISAQGAGPVKIGFYAARSHGVVDVDDCLLQTAAAARLRLGLLRWAETHHIPAYDERRHTGLLRHLFVRTNARGEALCCVVVNGNTLPHEGALTQSLRRAEPGLTGVLLSVHKERSNVILGQHLRLLWGRGELSDTLCGHEFSLSVPSFFQVNREQTEVLYARVLDFAALTGTETVLDLYCGVGTIALTLAKYAKHVIGGEIVPEAVANARENARGAGITNAEFFCGDAEKVAAELLRRGAAPHVIVTDPPRKGLAEGVIPVLARLNPAKIIYVSCDPGTLGRDVKRFAGEGYRASRAEACDLFPRTAHVETVVLLSKL